MIQISNLCKTYGNKTVLNNISFQVKKGEILGVLGPNGAGKSTLIMIFSEWRSELTFRPVLLSFPIFPCAARVFLRIDDFEGKEFRSVRKEF